MENFKIISNKEKEYFNFLVEMFTLVIGKMIYFMVRESIYIKKEIDIRDLFEMEKKKDLEPIITLMVINMKVTGSTIKNTVMECIIIFLLEKNTMEIGLMEGKKALESFFSDMEMNIEEISEIT